MLTLPLLLTHHKEIKKESKGSLEQILWKKLFLNAQLIGRVWESRTQVRRDGLMEGSLVDPGFVV